jgi:hypothetical protein
VIRQRKRLQPVGIGGSGFARKATLAGSGSRKKVALAALASPGRQPFAGSAFARKEGVTFCGAGFSLPLRLF